MLTSCLLYTSSLSAALHGAGLTGIDRLLVSDGSITSKDWEWLRNNRAAFAALTEFEISDRVQTADLPDAPVGSPAYPSIFPYQLQKVVIPQSVRIGSNAFDGCNELRIVDITNAYEIGESAFSQCHALQSVAFPKVTSIENAAFSGCDGLTYASLPSLCTIGCLLYTSIGIMTARWAKLFGAKQVILTDIDETKQRFAQERGFTVINSGKENLKERIDAMTDGRGVDVVIEGTGCSAGINDAIEIVRVGGTIVWLGNPHADTTIQLNVCLLYTSC